MMTPISKQQYSDLGIRREVTLTIFIQDLAIL